MDFINVNYVLLINGAFFYGTFSIYLRTTYFLTKIEDILLKIVRYNSSKNKLNSNKNCILKSMSNAHFVLFFF